MKLQIYLHETLSMRVLIFRYGSLGVNILGHYVKSKKKVENTFRDKNLAQFVRKLIDN